MNIPCHTVGCQPDAFPPDPLHHTASYKLCILHCIGAHHHRLLLIRQLRLLHLCNGGALPDASAILTPSVHHQWCWSASPNHDQTPVIGLMHNSPQCGCETHKSAGGLFHIVQHSKVCTLPITALVIFCTILLEARCCP